MQSQPVFLLVLATVCNSGHGLKIVDNRWGASSASDAMLQQVTRPKLTVKAVGTIAEQRRRKGAKEVLESFIVSPMRGTVLTIPQLDSFQTSSRGVYNGMMFGTGMRLSPDEILITARVCTKYCVDPSGSDNTIAIGRVSIPNASSIGSFEMGKESSWQTVKEVFVPHDRQMKFAGAEDPRLYFASKKSFNILVNMGNSDCEQSGQHRNMHYLKLNKDFSIQKECRINVPQIEPCSQSQKNWMPLAISETEHFFVYSIRPFQVLKFDADTCTAQSEKLIPKVDLSLRGSSSFMFATATRLGNVYLALGHQDHEHKYAYVLIAVLVKPGSSKPDLLGVSCPQRLQLPHQNFGYAYPTSVINLSSEHNTGELMFHIDDQQVVLVQIEGIPKFIDDAYDWYKLNNTAATCNPMSA